MHSIAIHGGAGTILPEQMTPELERAYMQTMQDALEAGEKILAKRGSAIQAVIAAVLVLEDAPLFNAGKGSVFTSTGSFEMDAALMDGTDLSAGACAGVWGVKNPILLADAIRLKSPHIMLAGSGAFEFAVNESLEVRPASYFHTDFRYSQWQAVRDTDRIALDHNLEGIEALMRNKKFGTVGAVACDEAGNIAAATSTGGMTNKRYGRVGDTPIIGAGCYANNATCAISATGHGEIFMQAVAAYDVSCLMEYRGMSLSEAMEEVVLKKLVRMNGEGGLIGVDASGNLAMVFNSAGMYRGARHADGKTELAIYK